MTRPAPPAVAPGPPKLEVEGGIERAPCALAGPEYQSIHFVLRGAEFDGLQGMTAEQLAGAYQPYVGRDVPISVVCEIRDRAGTILRDAGYVAAVQVPEQRIANGTVHFQVLMAHLTQVRVRGDATGAERIIAGYLNQLTKSQVFNRFEAERYLLLASDLPGYTVRLTLRPAGTAPGDVIGDVTVQRTPAYADFNVQNEGSHQLGPWGGLLRAELFGLTGLGDRTTFSVFSTADFHEQQTIQIGHEFRVGPEGLSVSDNFTYAWARPSIPNASVLARTLLNTFE
ncbi:MAG TPA: POTRA domain-containing protein, partial [Sphingomicrobium sp.]|nr:POTRA domain-containing protein [Sphingomicrobium sp.]